MSEKLTVAELLARNGRKEESADSSRPRRRRRSLEDGGVSVAELTGSIPVVEDEDIDKSSAESTQAAAPTQSKEPAKPERRSPATPAAATAAAAGGASAGAAASAVKNAPAGKPAENAKNVKPVSERPEEKTGQLSAVQQQREADKAQQLRKPGGATFGDVEMKPGADSAATPDPKTERRTSPADIRKTTGVVPESASEKKPDQKPEPSAKPSVPAAAAATTAAAGAAATKKTGVVKTASEDGDRDAKRSVVASKQKDDDKNQTVTANEERNPAVSEAPAEFHELEATLGEDEVLEFEDDRISWPAMIGQALAAIVVGVGVFFGFSLLWANAPGILVLVLALAVTLVMVGLVHALLRHSDKLLMVLAFIVGLVLTIGPRFIIGL